MENYYNQEIYQNEQFDDDQQKNLIGEVYNDPWLFAEYGYQINEFILKLGIPSISSKNQLPKAKRGKRSRFSDDIKIKAVMDYYYCIQYQGKTVADFLMDRFSTEVSISLFYEWKKNYEEGKLIDK